MHLAGVCMVVILPRIVLFHQCKKKYTKMRSQSGIPQDGNFGHLDHLAHIVILLLFGTRIDS